MTDLFEAFDLIHLTKHELKQQILEHNNLIVFIKSHKNYEIINDVVFRKNVLIFFDKMPVNFNNKFENVFVGPQNIDKVRNLAEYYFNKKIHNYSNLQLVDTKLTNRDNKKSSTLTVLESEILLTLFQFRELKKTYIKEELLKIKNEVETRSPETHISRIRKKINQIGSDLKIVNKDDVFSI